MIELCPAKQLAGYFENLKGRVLSSMNGQAENGFVVAFTSCEENEGVTSISVNFAASLASQGERNVLLIDGDLKRPELHHFFEKKEQKQAPDETQGEANLVWRTLRANRNLDCLHRKAQPRDAEGYTVPSDTSYAELAPLISSRTEGCTLYSYLHAFQWGRRARIDHDSAHGAALGM